MPTKERGFLEDLRQYYPRMVSPIWQFLSPEIYPVASAGRCSAKSCIVNQLVHQSIQLLLEVWITI